MPIVAYASMGISVRPTTSTIQNYCSITTRAANSIDFYSGSVYVSPSSLIKCLKEAWQMFDLRRHFEIKPKKTTLSPNLNLNPSPNQ